MTRVAPNFGNSKLIVDSEVYTIKDLELKDSTGRVLCTISETILKADQETRGHQHDALGEAYHFISGSGIMILGEEPAIVYRVGPESIIFVDKGIKHQVINRSSTLSLTFITLYFGPSQRPPLKGKKA